MARQAQSVACLTDLARIDRLFLLITLEAVGGSLRVWRQETLAQFLLFFNGNLHCPVICSVYVRVGAAETSSSEREVEIRYRVRMSVIRWEQQYRDPK